MRRCTRRHLAPTKTQTPARLKWDATSRRGREADSPVQHRTAYTCRQSRNGRRGVTGSIVAHVAAGRRPRTTQRHQSCLPQLSRRQGTSTRAITSTAITHDKLCAHCIAGRSRPWQGGQQRAQDTSMLTFTRHGHGAAEHQCPATQPPAHHTRPHIPCHGVASWRGCRRYLPREHNTHRTQGVVTCIMPRTTTRISSTAQRMHSAHSEDHQLQCLQCLPRAAGRRKDRHAVEDGSDDTSSVPHGSHPRNTRRGDAQMHKRGCALAHHTMLISKSA
jgi:hypothetical protein